MKAKFSIIAAVLALAGCGDNNIDTVKNYTLPQKKSMTIGAAIDGYEGCKSVKWEDVSAKDLKAVKVTCEVSDAILKAQFDNQNAKYEKAVQKAKDEAQKNVDKALELIMQIYNDNNLKTEASADASKEELLALANKFCKYDKEKEKKHTFGAPVTCDNDALTSELLDKHKLNGKSIMFDNFVNQFQWVALDSQRPPKPIFFGDMPKQINSRSYELKFIINTDKTVDIDRKAVMIEDGERKEIGSGVLGKFYER